MSEARFRPPPSRGGAERFSESATAEFALREPVPVTAHAKIKRIVGLWQSIQPGPGLLPGRKDFDPLRAPDLLNNLWLVDVVDDDPRRYRLRLVGGAVTEAGYRIRKGMYLGDVGTAEEAAGIGAMFGRLEASRRINWRRGPAAHDDMEHVRDLERVILPMASDGVTVDLFVCLSIFYYADGRET